jgi:hypothetical protein
MPGTKIINVLKDDTFKDILDLFRKTDAEDVVFVLPKRSAVFRREDHFAAFASESRRTDKRVSILCSNGDVNAWARKYSFTVIAKSATQATLADAPLNDEDEETRNPNIDAYERDVVVPSDERIGIVDTDETEEAEGSRVEDEDADPDSEDETPLHEHTAVEKSGIQEDEENDDYDQTLLRYGPNDMEFYDDEGNLIGARARQATASLAAVRGLDGIRRQSSGKAVGIKGTGGRTTKVGIRTEPTQKLPDDSVTEDTSAVTAPKTDPRGRWPQADEGLDYIDAVWRDTVRGSTERKEPEGRWKGLFGTNTKKSKSPRGNRIMSTNRRMGPKARKALFVSIVVLALSGAAFLFFGMGEARVQVVPVSRDLEFEIQVQASDAFAEVDPLFNKIPGQLFEIERTIEREFNSTGSQEVAAKAKGTITVYNDFSSAPQTLIATTRFEDLQGRIFRTLRTVTVPGRQADGTPGTVTVDSIADKPGPEYNIEPTTFVIPAFREQGDTARLEGFSGASQTAFQGGALGLSSVVTTQDLDNAISQVTEELQSAVQQAFDSQTADLKLINAAQVRVASPSVSAEVNQAVETFVVSATGTLSTVGFRESDLQTLLNENALRNWQVTVRPEFLDIHFDDIRFVDDRGILAFTATALGKGFVRLDDEEAIIRDIQGMDRDAVRNYFRAAEGVRSSTVVLSPLWVRSVPNEPAAIKLQIHYEVVE